MIKVENIRGRSLFVGAEDDALWDTAKYIRRMAQRLETHPHTSTYEALLYEHGTHSVFPQSLLKIMLPVVSGAMVRVFRAGRQHPKECKQTRIYIDRRIAASLTAW